MVQTERETGALRGQFARQAAVQASAAAQAESARAQAEQLSRKLAAARAEVRRYQTRMFLQSNRHFTVSAAIRRSLHLWHRRQKMVNRYRF